MSTEIDNRVVSIQFDNTRFEQNVRHSIGTLHDLDDALKFQDGAKGIQEVSKEVNRLSFESIRRGIEDTIGSFNALETAAKTVIASITLKMEAAVKKWTSAFSTDMMKSGFGKYDQQVASMQTLVNATGKSVDELEQKLDKLQWFSDETSYSFSEMMTALQTMASSGSDLDKSIDLMMGLANATAYAGQNAQSFVMASRNITQSYSMGYLNLQDWKSLELAKVNSKGLVETLIRAGEEAGTIKKGAVTVQNFRESLKDKWATREVMEQGFGRFAQMSNMAYEMVQEETDGVKTASDAYAILEEQYDDIYMKAAKAAQEAKTFTEAIDATKDALSSSWSTTYKYIFGNYEEAKVLWTGLANILYDAFVEPRNAINDMLMDWKNAGGRIDLIEAFCAVLTNLSNIITAIKEGFREIFPQKTAEDLKEITGKFADFNKSIMLSDNALMGIKVSVKAIASILKVLTTTFKAIVHAIFPVTNLFSSITELLALALITIGDLITKIASLVTETNILSGLGKVVRAILYGIVNLIQLVLSGISALVKIIQAIDFSFVYYILDGIRFVISGIATGIGAIASGIIFIVKWIAELFGKLRNSKFFTSVGNGFLTVVYAIRDGFMAVVAWIQKAYASISAFINKTKNLTFKEKIEAIKNALKSMATSIREILVNSPFGKMFDKTSEGAHKFSDALLRVKERLAELKDQYSLGQIAALAFTGVMLLLMVSITRVFSGFGALMSTVTMTLRTFQNIVNRVFTRTTSFLNIALSIGILASSLYLLSKVPINDLKQIVIYVGSLIVAMAAITIVTGWLAKSTSAIGSGISNLAKLLIAFSSIGVAFMAMAKAFQMLEEIKFDKDLSAKIGWMILTMVANLLFSLTLINAANPKAKNAIKVVVILLAFAKSIGMLVSTVEKFSALPLAGLGTTVKALTSLMVGFGALVLGLGHIRIGSAFGILATLLVFKSVIPALVNMSKLLEDVPNDTLSMLLQAFSSTISSIIISMSVMMVAFGLFGKKIEVAFKGIGKFVASLAIIGYLIMYLSSKYMDPGRIGMGIVAITLVGAFVFALLKGVIGIVEQFRLFNLSVIDIKWDTLTKGIAKIMKSIGSVMLAIILSTAALLYLVDKYDIGSVAGAVVAAIVSVGVIMAGLAGMFWAIGRLQVNNSAAGAIAASISAIVILFGELIVLTFIPYEKLFMPVVTISAILLGLTGMFWSLSQFVSAAQGIWGFTKYVLMMATLVGTLMIVARTIIDMSNTANPDSISKCTKCLIGMFTVFTAMAPLLALTQKIIKNDNEMTRLWKVALVTVGALTSVAGLLFALSKWGNTSAFSKATLAIASLSAVFAVMSLSLVGISKLAKNKGDIGKMLAIVGSTALAIGACAGSLVLLSKNTDATQLEKVQTVLKKTIILFSIVAGIGSMLAASKIGAGGIITFAVAFSALSLLLSVAVKNIADALTKLIRELRKYLDVVKNFSGDTFTQLPLEAYEAGKNMMVQFSDGIRDNLETVRSAIASMIANVKESLNNENFAPVGQGFVRSLALGMASNGAAMQSASEIVESDAMVSGIRTTVSYAQGAVGSADVAQTSGLAVGNAFLSGLGGARTAGAVGYQQGEAYTKSFNNAIKTIPINPTLPVTSPYGAVGAIGIGPKWLQDAVSSTTNFLWNDFRFFGLDTLHETWDKLMDPDGAVVHKAKKTMQTVTNDIFNNPDIMSAANNFLGNISGDKATETFNKIKEQFTSFADEVKSGFDFSNMEDQFNSINDTVGQTKSTFETLYDTISGQMDLFKEFDFTADISTDQMLKNMSDNILGVTEWSNDMAMLAARGVSQPLLEKLGSLGPQGFKYVKAFINMTDEELQEANSMWGMSLKLPSYAAEEVEASYKFAGEVAIKGFSDALDKYSDMLDAYYIGELTMEQIASALYDYTPRAVKAVSDGIPQFTPVIVDGGEQVLEDSTNQLSRPAYDAGAAVAQTFMDGYNNVMGQFYGFGNARLDKVYNAIMDNNVLRAYVERQEYGHEWMQVYEDYKKMGDWAFEGIKRSFFNNKSEWIATARGFAALLPQSVQDELEIGSPSKVMYELGAWGIKGFTNAIIDGTPEVTNITEDMTDSLIDTMSGFSEEVNKYLNSEGDLNPVISPVLDLTNVQNGASTLDSLFSADKAIRATSVYDDNARMAAEIAAANRTDQLETVINACVNKVIEAMVANQPVVETNIYNDVDPFGIFKAVRSETKKFTRANGYNPLI